MRQGVAFPKHELKPPEPTGVISRHETRIYYAVSLRYQSDKTFVLSSRHKHAFMDPIEWHAGAALELGDFCDRVFGKPSLAQRPDVAVIDDGGAGIR